MLHTATTDRMSAATTAEHSETYYRDVLPVNGWARSSTGCGHEARRAGVTTFPRGDDIEWVVAPVDAGRAVVGLRTDATDQRLRPIAGVLPLPARGARPRCRALVDDLVRGGIGEVDVVTRNVLATTAEGCMFAVSLMASDPVRPVNDQRSAGEILALVQGALELSGR